MSPSRSFLALICFAALGAAPNVAHAMVPPDGAAAGAANPGHGWIPGHHINPMLESGHASIMAKNFGAPYWRALRMRLIMALTAASRRRVASEAAPSFPSRPPKLFLSLLRSCST